MKHVRIFLFCLAASAFFSVSGLAQEPGSAAVPELSRLARSKAWQRLLFYKTHWFTGWRSTVDGEGFFLSPDGARDPEKELRATLAALERGGGSYGKLQQPIRCAFPARAAFLEKALGKKFPVDPCPDLDDYFRKLDPAAVSLVFATSYPSNPASMFGHSFLKVTGRKNTGADAGKFNLLDWSLNYAAMVPPDESPFAFMYFGMAGGYAGQFALVPYYAKIEEYGYSEGRDIWEYDLNLSDEEILALVRSVWEIETNSHIYYYFADENCSFEALALLEAVRPDWDLSGYFIHMIPGESVKRVTGVPGLIKAVRMRPSLERRLRTVADSLSPGDWARFSRARRELNPEGLEGLSLQAYLLYLQAEKKRRGDAWGKQEEAAMREALKLRTTQGKPAEVTEFGGEKSRPDFSHGAYQLGLGPALERGGKTTYGAVELSIRFAYHDLLDPDPGYMAHSEVLFPNFRFRYSARTGRFVLDEAELLSLVSLTPWNLVRKPLAWRVQSGFQRLNRCAFCRGLHGEGAVGAAFSLVPERWTVWSMLGGEADAAEHFPAVVRAAPLLEVGSLFTLPGEGKVLLQGRVARNFARNPEWYAEAKVGLSQPLAREISVRSEAQFTWRKNLPTEIDARVLAVHYF